MFLRFSTYSLQTGQQTLEVSLQYSVWHKDKGQPRAYYLAYLGSIRICRLHQEAAQRRFWERALAKLNTVDLKPRQRSRIEHDLATRVQRPAQVVPLDASEKRRRYWQAQWTKAAKKAGRKR